MSIIGKLTRWDKTLVGFILNEEAELKPLFASKLTNVVVYTGHHLKNGGNIWPLFEMIAYLTGRHTIKRLLEKFISGFTLWNENIWS